MIVVDAIVVDKTVEGVDVVMGIDAINQLGGVTLGNGIITFGYVQSAVSACVESVSKLRIDNDACVIEDMDFYAKLNGSYWTVEWFWKKKKPPVLKNMLGLYNKGLEGNKREKFETAVDQWVKEGFLIPWNGSVQNGILPLMAVEQPTKNKVRPVLD